MKQPAWIKSVRRLGWVGLVFVSAVMIISAVEKKEASLTNTLTIDIEPLPGEHMLITREDVLEKIEVSFGFALEGMPLSSIDMERVERILEDDTFVLEANAFVDSNNHIKISVRQRQPVLRVIDANGLNYYLDKNGMRMELSRHFTARVLVLTGHVPPHVPDFLERPHNGLKDMFTLAELIRKDPLFDPLFDQINLDERGNVMLVPKVGDQIVKMGSAEDMDRKLDNLKIFYKEALPFEGWKRYESIDLSYKGQVVCKKT